MGLESLLHQLWQGDGEYLPQSETEVERCPTLWLPLKSEDYSLRCRSAVASVLLRVGMIVILRKTKKHQGTRDGQSKQKMSNVERVSAVSLVSAPHLTPSFAVSPIGSTLQRLINNQLLPL